MHLLNNYLVTGVLLSINISVFIVLSILAWNGTEIDGFVKFIIDRKKQYVSEKKFIPWDYYNKYDPDIHIKRGYLDIKDNVGFLIKKDALRVFGYKGGHYHRALRKIEGTKKKEVWFSVGNKPRTRN